MDVNLKQFIFLFTLFLIACNPPQPSLARVAPTDLKGHFQDEYQVQFTITDTLWIQYPSNRYHIVHWDTVQQFAIAQNDGQNPDSPRKWTRIDYMRFSGMAPYLWGFCLTEYSAATYDLAKLTPPPDRVNPRKGCNGFPFSRMKMISGDSIRSDIRATRSVHTINPK